MVSRLRFLPLAFLLLGACLTEGRDWTFVQSIGGMALGTPYKSAEGVMLPVRVDVSGMQTITTRPTTMNSGLAVKKITAERRGSEVSLRLVTAAAGSGSSSQANDVSLGRLEAGRYTVQYAEPGGRAVYLGQIVVTP